jgi:hypothetical protein
MQDRFSRLAALALVAAASVGLAGQAPTGLSNWTAPRTPWGDPDLQGTWDVATLTPIERPDNVGGRLELTEEEAAEIERTERARVAARARPSNPDRGAPPVDGNVGGYNNVWIQRGETAFKVNGKYRTSIIIDPPDGKIPPQTPEARRRNMGARGSVARPTSDAPESAGGGGVRGEFDDMELRPLGERCLLGFGSTSGPPTLPNYFYNNYKQIVQTPTHVMILYEMVHDVRIIPLSREHSPSSMRKWLGDSVGRWEGNTLVVETINFTDKTRFRGSSPDMKVTERFTRTEDGTILYRFTIDDPKTWTRPWTGEYPWVKTDDRIYEYACHEGNYALENIMRGARYQDKVAAGQAPAPRLPQ